MTTDPSTGDRDQYNRMLRYVDHDDTDVARELLEAGMVRLYGANRGLAREWRYLEAARAAGTGLWRDCPRQG